MVVFVIPDFIDRVEGQEQPAEGGRKIQGKGIGQPEQQQVFKHDLAREVAAGRVLALHGVAEGT